MSTTTLDHDHVAGLGPVAGAEYHVALGFYPEGDSVARWDDAKWNTAGSVWMGPPPRLDVSCDVLSVRITEGRDQPMERFRPAAAIVVVDDPEGLLSPWRTAPEGDTYATVRPGIDLVVWATIGATTVPRFAGIVDAIADEFPDADSHRVRFEAFDYAMLLAAYDGVEQAPVGAGERAGARLHRIADSAGYLGPRNFDVGTVALQATTLAKSAWDEAGMVTDTELGALWADRSGTLQFRDRNGLVGDPHYTAVQAVFGEVEPEICYTAIELASDSDKIKNVVTIARAGGAAVTVTNLTSVALYRTRTYRRLDLIHASDADSTPIANAQLATYAYAANRVDALTIDMAVLTAAQRVTVLNLDALWRIQVRRRAEGVQIVADLQVQAVEETATPGAWVITFKTFAAANVFNVARWDRDPWDTGKWGY